MKSPIRWAGSKKKLLPFLRKLWPGGRTRYIEPFAGSACLYFDLNPSRAILSDLNPELITAWRCLRDDANAVTRRLRRLTPSEKNYYRIRANDPSDLCSADIAARFFFLNRFCFNGLYRTNVKGQFNVPYGHQLKNEHVDFDLLKAAGSNLQRAQLFVCDFESTLDKTRNGDFVYLDPPYATSEVRTFREYLPNSFSTSDLVRLATALKELDRKHVTFVMSYAATEMVQQMFSEWPQCRITVRRNIAGFSGHRRSATEILLTNLRHAF